MGNTISAALELIDINDYLCWQDLQEDICQDFPDDLVDDVGEAVEQWWQEHEGEIESDGDE